MRSRSASRSSVVPAFEKRFPAIGTGAYFLRLVRKPAANPPAIAQAGVMKRIVTNSRRVFSASVPLSGPIAWTHHSSVTQWPTTTLQITARTTIPSLQLPGQDCGNNSADDRGRWNQEHKGRLRCPHAPLARAGMWQIEIIGECSGEVAAGDHCRHDDWDSQQRSHTVTRGLSIAICQISLPNRVPRRRIFSQTLTAGWTTTRPGSFEPQRALRTQRIDKPHSSGERRVPIHRRADP